LLGLRELDRNLYVRPDNLAGGVAGIRERLHVLGLEAAAAIFLATQFDEAREKRARSLWEGRALTRAYDQARRQLEAWMARAERLDPEVAARECYLLGDKAVRQLVFDPLLPAPLVDTAARAAFTDVVLEFDEVGRNLWRRVLTEPPTGRSPPGAALHTH
jgi:phenylacetic acid degradation operon negative regulatory protein